MDVMFMIVILFLGFSAGSFLNVCAFRLGSAESALWGRSHCVSCRHVIRWRDMIPILSFLALGGRCRDCHSLISFQYPIVEGATAVLFFLVYHYYSRLLFLHSPFAGFFSELESVWYAAGLVFYLVAVFLLFGIAIYDFRVFLIAPAFMLPFFALGAIGLFLRWFGGSSFESIGIAFGAAFAVFLFFAAIWFFSRGAAMGFGDAELAAGIVLFLGPVFGALAVVLSFWIGAIFGVAAMALGKAHMKSALPFGPFLVVGAFIGLFWGDALIAKYVEILF